MVKYTDDSYGIVNILSGQASHSDEVLHLQLQCKKQFEEDIARIFDESIYSDIEVVCGKLKILTHSCILKARTHKFYHKLEAILHVNIGRNTFDEIYSFISDAYTECNIKKQEKEIIECINKNLSLEKAIENTSTKSKSEEKDELEIFSTPNCISPEERCYQKSLSSSPSTELTKEYYALVPIEGNILDRELLEQDTLSNAFQSINKSQFENNNAKHNLQCAKPTSLYLNSSHVSKINKHSNSCDIFLKTVIDFEEKKTNNGQTGETFPQSETEKSLKICNKTDKDFDPTYTPDSLAADEPSSSSDYLSAAYAVSPGTVFTSGLYQSQMDQNITKMDNLVTTSDSGLETAGMLESLNSQNDITLTDMSLHESTTSGMHESLNSQKDVTLADVMSNENISYEVGSDDNPSPGPVGNLQNKSHVQMIAHSSIPLNSPIISTSIGKKNNSQISSKSSFTEVSTMSTKEEKQRQNEEIVILESSSLSSETGSWESVFPPKLPDKDLCERFITNERRIPHNISKHEIINNVCPSLVPKSHFKSTSSCFIDAASLADEGDEVLVVQTVAKNINTSNRIDTLEPSQPVPCTLKRDLSPNDWSESNDNEDSLEKSESKDPVLMNKDLSPTIFEMTPVTEGSLCWNECETNLVPVEPTYLKHDKLIAANGCFSGVIQNYPTPQEFNAGIKPGNMKHEELTKGNCSMASSLQNRPEAQSIKNEHISENTDTLKIVQQNQCVHYSLSTPHNSIISVREHDIAVYESSGEINTLGSRHVDNIPNRRIDEDANVSKFNTPESKDDTLVSHPEVLAISSDDIVPKQIQVSETTVDSSLHYTEPEDLLNKQSRVLSNSYWVVDMSILDSRLDLKSTNSGESHQSRGSVISSACEKSTQNFFIDLATLPDAPTLEQVDKDEGNEKKNIFSMFIDLGDKPTTSKDIPSRFNSNTKKTTKTEMKQSSKATKSSKACVSKMIEKTKHLIDESFEFEKLESMCADTSIGISEIINRPLETANFGFPNMKRKDNDLMKKVIQEEPASDREFLDPFVKLSDLDKPALTAKPVTIDFKKENHGRMSRSIPDNDWNESSQSIDMRSNNILSSFHSENALSLNRLFPHLKHDFSRSLPGSLSSRTKSPSRLGPSFSPSDVDECHASEIASEMSSVQSSYSRSLADATEQIANLIGNADSKLGQDLLRMFLEEIGPDVVIEVSGRRIKAHKCILASRCQYFAGILSGGWVESAGNVISLPPKFTYNVVHFALCHIYSGVSVIPETIKVVELATLADMLGLDGLKDGIMYMLKTNYCHHFHSPCATCMVGVLECLPLASVYGLDDLYRKCLRWITKHFCRVWPTKPFAMMPFELIEKCCQEHIINLAPYNFVETVHGCGIIVSGLGTARWAGVVARMCRRVLHAAALYGGAHLGDVLRAMTGPAPPDTPPAAAHALYECVAAAIQWAPPDQACLAYRILFIHCQLMKELRPHHSPRPDLLADSALHSLLSAHALAWRALCERALLQHASRVVRSPEYSQLPDEMRARLRERTSVAPLHAASSALRLARPRHTPASLAPACGGVDIARVRARFMSKNQNQPLHFGSEESVGVDARPGFDKSLRGSAKPREERPTSGARKSSQPNVRTTKAQEERAKFNLRKSSQRPVTTKVGAARAARGPHESAKARYLQPRPPPSARKAAPRMVSSSESSRNASPVLAGGAARTQAPRQRARTADPSTDSLTDSVEADKYATYTKVKHTSATGAVQPAKKHDGPVPTITKSPVISTSSRPTTSKTTKIPVYIHKNRETTRRVQDKSVTRDRKPSGSLMNATKSSQAKMVAKTVKDSKMNKQGNQKPRSNRSEADASSSEVEVPLMLMERSGTFLKDEPTFKTTSSDVE